MKIISNISKKTKKDIIKFLGVYFLAIFIGVVLWIILLFFMLSPSGEQGINKELLKASFDVYIINNALTERESLKYFEYANQVWQKYNINLILGDIYFKELNLTSEEITFLFKGITGEEINLSEICKKEYMPIINKIFPESDELKIIILNSEGGGGRGCLCTCNFVVLNTKDKMLFLDYVGWNLAHELGHLFGLYDLKGERNLMGHRAPEKLFKSHFLNQGQVDKVVAKVSKFIS